MSCLRGWLFVVIWGVVFLDLCCWLFWVVGLLCVVWGVVFLVAGCLLCGCY